MFGARKWKNTYAQFVIRKLWNEEMPHHICEGAQPLKIKGKTLVIAAKSPAWFNEIHFLKDEWLKKVNAMGLVRIEKLDFEVDNRYFKIKQTGENS